MSRLLIKHAPPLIAGETALLTVQGGFSTMIDANDFDWLNQFKWRLSKGKYCRYVYTRMTVGSITKIVKIHRLITNCPPDKDPHHKDRNTLNNTRANLEPLYKSDHRIEHGKNR
jgi:hypothetical protein